MASNIRDIIHHSYIIKYIIILFDRCFGSKITCQSLLYDRSVSMGFFFFFILPLHVERVPARVNKTKTNTQAWRPPVVRAYLIY